MKKIIVAITGATGVIYGIRLLEVLNELRVESHLIMSEHAMQNIEIETDYDVQDIERLASKSYSNRNMAAAVASGSFQTDGMIIAPCTVKTLSGLANSYDENLIVRAADCMLKERRPLVVVVRETPLHIGHLELMMKVSKMGGILLPPVPAFYHGPQSIDDIINHIVGKMLDQVGIEHALFRRWGSFDPLGNVPSRTLST